MDITCISDLHGHYPKLEGGDLLIVAGDLTASDSPDQLWLFSQWMIDQNYKYKIVVAGNHDNTFYENYYQKNVNPFVPFVYLCDSSIEIESLKIWGSPWTKKFEGMNPHCMAFTVNTEEELAQKWALIPKDIDILVTHIPQLGILDELIYPPSDSYEYSGGGSISLGEDVVKLKNLKLHVFGHIHEAYGMCGFGDPPYCVNASIVNERYQPVNKPLRVIL